MLVSQMPLATCKKSSLRAMLECVARLMQIIPLGTLSMEGPQVYRYLQLRMCSMQI